MPRPVIRGHGRLKAEVVRVDRPISLLGDLDPRTGRIGDLEASGRILAIPYVRGSTVGPYVLWAAARHGVAPLAIVARKIDLMLVTACALSEVPLFEGELPAGCVEFDLATGEYVGC